MKTFFLTLTIAVILSQTIHVYSVFESFSRLKGWLRIFQAVLFSSIISISILAFVLINNPKLALAGAFIEVVINYLYYAADFWANGFPTRKNRAGSILAYWRINWGKFLFGTIIPFSIFIFSEQIIKL